MSGYILRIANPAASTRHRGCPQVTTWRDAAAARIRNGAASVRAGGFQPFTEARSAPVAMSTVSGTSRFPTPFHHLLDQPDDLSGRLAAGFQNQRHQPCRPGNLGYPVFDTAVGRIGVYICYDRHFPEGWRELGLAGAKIVFNPSATTRGHSKYLWELEQPAAAVANEYFVGAINRVGSEDLEDTDYYGSSYFASPRGQIIDGIASDTSDEVVVRDLDLDLIEEVRHHWAFYRDRRPEICERITKGLVFSAPPLSVPTRLTSGRCIPYWVFLITVKTELRIVLCEGKPVQILYIKISSITGFLRRGGD